MRLQLANAFSALVLAGSALVSGCASVAHTPYPPLKADTSPEALQRGEVIFRGTCDGCHRATGAERATGAPMKDVPGWLGTLHTANLTSHPTAGIGQAKDEELARTIRYGVSRDDRLLPMPSSAMGDKDLEAVLGFLRSSHPLFAPDATVAPRTDFSFFGGMAFRLVTKVPEYPAQGIPVPPKGPTLEYGRYMASVYDCSGCHTDSFDPADAEGSKGFAGGRSFVGADGESIHSSNLTFDETGLAGWSLEDFSRAVRDGLGPGGTIVRYPMPRYRSADDVDMKALYDYLRSRAPRRNKVSGAQVRPAPAAPAPTSSRTPAVSRGPLAPGDPVRTSVPFGVLGQVLAQSEPQGAPDPAALFSRMGCTLCHAPGARYHDRLAQAAGKPELTVAQWIRNPEKFSPGTAMPTYASLLDEPSALALARWIRSGGPSPAKK